ncbi:MAG: hypothetical protein Q8N13_11135 [Acidovorax sp.]|nr:hypothetical protein [Acidovorax sp.]
MSTTFLGNLQLELVQGDDYLEADARALHVYGRAVCWPPAVDSVRFLVFEPNDCGSLPVATVLPLAVIDIEGTFVPATSTTPADAKFDIPRAESLKLAPGVRRYMLEVRGLLASGSVITMARGQLTVLSSQL